MVSRGEVVGSELDKGGSAPGLEDWPFSSRRLAFCESVKTGVDCSELDGILVFFEELPEASSY
jgi:hypothetical protein